MPTKACRDCLQDWVSGPNRGSLPIPVTQDSRFTELQSLDRIVRVAAAAVDGGCWEQAQRQNSFFVGPDSSSISQLLSDPVKQITCRVQTIQCGQCAWQRRVVSVRCWVLAVIITPPSSVKLANFGFYFALHCTRHLHVLLITGDCRGCRIL